LECSNIGEVVSNLRNVLLVFCLLNSSIAFKSKLVVIGEIGELFLGKLNTAWAGDVID
jgi:hypothetical protein